MSVKNLFKVLILAAVLFASLGFTPGVQAAATCGDYYTVVRGDTLREIAAACGTTVAALQRANPQITNPNRIYPGQVLVMPGAIQPGNSGYDVYVVQRGDTLRRLATRFGTTVDALLKLNPDITNANVIYEGQRLAVPRGIIPDTGAGQVYVVQRGDTLNRIARRFDTTVDAILKLNPKITNANRIYPGQQIVLPDTPTTYVVQRGDTLRIIAARFNTTVAALLDLNPTIKDPNLIYVGQVLRIG